MLKDIPRIEVTEVAIAILPVEGEENTSTEEALWNVYILNLKNIPIDNVIISSKGYGSLNVEMVKTSTLRQFLGTIAPNAFMQVEAIQEKVFGLNNEYLVSFYIKNEIFDKKFVFLPETIRKDFFTTVPILNRKGVMIR